MGQWRFAERGVCYRGEEAITRASAARGKRNIFHDDLLLVLEHDERPIGQPPLAVERHLILTLMHSDWLDAGAAAADAGRSWRSEPLLLSASASSSGEQAQPAEAVLAAVAGRLFAEVHVYLHAKQPAQPS
jgi:hypothetical protein